MSLAPEEMKRTLAITVLVALATCYVTLATSYRPRTVEEKVREADLIILGVGTVEGREKGETEHPYECRCRFTVTEVLWPSNLMVQPEFVVKHFAWHKWPSSWWNYNATTGVFFFTKTPRPDQQRDDLYKMLASELGDPIGDEDREMIRAAIEKTPVNTNTWTQLDRFDDSYESTTNLFLIRRLVQTIKTGVPTNACTATNQSAPLRVTD